MIKKLIFAWLTISLLSGCGELSYKRGASVKDLENTKKTCQSATEQEIEKCLYAHGWVVKKLDGVDFIIDSTTSKNTIPNAEIDHGVATTNEATKATTLNADQPHVPAVKSDPFETFKISSWWKTSANDTKFQADIQQCKTQLGESHIPDMAKQLYSKAFITCMYELGWKALGKTK